MSLPSGYKRLEYIQSSGSQYIDENFVPDATTKVIMDFQMLSPGTTNECIFGVSGQFSFRWYGTNSAFRSNGANSVNFPSSVSSTARHTVSKETLTCTIDGADSVTNTAGTVTLSLYLFAQHTASGASNYAKVRCYSRQVYKNGALVRDYIPCKTDGEEIGLWDDVNSVFYGNAGTGTFTAGPEVGVATPENFRLSSSTDDSATLAWDAVDGATGYKLYRDGVLIATLTDTSYTDAIQPFAFYVYTLTAYNDGGESEAAALTYYAEPDNPILYLVTNRTAADVENETDKGFYNSSDINRVGAAVEYISGRFTALGYDCPVTVKKYWSESDTPTASQMEVYRQNIVTLRRQIMVLRSTPETPASMKFLNWADANNIEQILFDIEKQIITMASTFVACGPATCGGEYL